MFLCGIALSLLPLTSTFAQSVETKPGQSVVRGRVLYADSEQPLRRATLRLRQEFNQDFLKRSISTRRGEFTFQGVAAGTYYIEVEAPGILAFTNGTSFSEFGFGLEATNLQTVTVDGTNEVKTEIRVRRGGVLTGRVSYADGEPATRARIVLYRQRGEIVSLFFPPQAFKTNDQGVYRIEGLPAGQYFVGAVENHAGSNLLPRDAGAIVAAFHPTASNVSAATVVSVQAGSETRDVNIKFGDDPRRLSGTLKWKNRDAPIKHAVVFLRRMGDPELDLDYISFTKMVTPSKSDSVNRMMRDVHFIGLLSSNSPYAEVDENGRWLFQDLVPGTYRLSVLAELPANETVKPQKPNELLDSEDDERTVAKKFIRGSAEVTIKDKDIENFSIQLSEGGKISGTVVIEGKPDVPAVAVKLMTAAGPKLLFDFPEMVKQDRSFNVQSVPPGISRLDITQPGSHYYIKSINGKGLNLLNEPLTLNEGEQVTGVQIVLGIDVGTVEGRVVAGSGGVAGAGVVLLPVDQRKWPLRSLWGLARANAEGKFTMRLAPGDYIALCWSPANEPTVALESYAKANLTLARRITLQPLETKSIEFPIER